MTAELNTLKNILANVPSSQKRTSNLQTILSKQQWDEIVYANITGRKTAPDINKALAEDFAQRGKPFYTESAFLSEFYRNKRRYLAESSVRSPKPKTEGETQKVRGNPAALERWRAERKAAGLPIGRGARRSGDPQPSTPTPHIPNGPIPIAAIEIAAANIGRTIDYSNNGTSNGVEHTAAAVAEPVLTIPHTVKHPETVREFAEQAVRDIFEAYLQIDPPIKEYGVDYLEGWTHHDNALRQYLADRGVLISRTEPKDQPAKT